MDGSGEHGDDHDLDIDIPVANDDTIEIRLDKM